MVSPVASYAETLWMFSWLIIARMSAGGQPAQRIGDMMDSSSDVEKDEKDEPVVKVVTELFDPDGPDHWFDHCALTGR